MLPHLDTCITTIRFSTIEEFFPSSNFVSDRFNTGSSRTIDVTVVTKQVTSRKALKEASHITKEGHDSRGLDGLTENGVTSGQMNGIKHHLPGPAFLADIVAAWAIKKLQIMTKPVVVELPGTNRPNFLGSLGSPSGETENSLNCISDMSLGLGWK